MSSLCRPCLGGIWGRRAPSSTGTRRCPASTATLSRAARQPPIPPRSPDLALLRAMTHTLRQQRGARLAPHRKAAAFRLPDKRRPREQRGHRPRRLQWSPSQHRPATRVQRRMHRGQASSSPLRPALPAAACRPAMRTPCAQGRAPAGHCRGTTRHREAVGQVSEGSPRSTALPR